MVNRNSGKDKLYNFILSAILSCMFTFGLFIQLSPANITIVGIIKNNINAFIALLALAFFIFRKAVGAFFKKADEINLERAGKAGMDTRISFRMWGRHTCIIFLCWLPYLIICYPTITRGYDYFWQLLQGVGVFPLSNHHPVFSSYVFGVLFATGYKIGGASFGLFFTSLIQTILLATAMGLGVSVIKQLSVLPNKAFRIIVIIICLNPVFATHAVWVIKDSIFTSLCILFFLQCFIRMWATENKDDIPIIAAYPAIMVTGLLLSIYRNGILPITAIILLVLLYSELKSSDQKIKSKILMKWGVSCLCFTLAMVGWNSWLNFNSVYPTNAREALAMPTRHIMKTVYYHEDDLQDREKEAIKQAFREQIGNGATIKEIANRKFDINGDAIKPDYMNEEMVSQFVKTWFSLGIRHPGCYLDATLRGTDGYWNPLKSPWLTAYGQIIHAEVPTGMPEDDFANEGMIERQFGTLFIPTVKSLENASMDTTQTFEDLFDEYPWLDDLMHVKSAFPNARNKLRIIIERVERIPVISLLYSSGTYFWIMIICFGYLFSRKKTGRYLWPILLIWVLACLSPINGYTRYVLSINLMSLLMIGMCLTLEYDKRKEII